jgi:hypothetical protein
MAETITSAKAQPFSLSLSYACTTTDSRGGPTARTFNPSGTNWYRIFLTILAGLGTDILDPKEFLAYVRSVLGVVQWNVQINVFGRVVITYLSTGTGTITWGAGAALIRNILGFAGDIGPLAQNVSVAAPIQPAFLMLECCHANDTNWSSEFAGMAGMELPDNSVDWLGDGYQKIRRGYTSRFHPRTPLETAGGAAAAGSVLTPYWPLDASMTRILTPSDDATIISPGQVWSVHEFLATAMGKPIGVTHGRFQDLVQAPGSITFDVCYLGTKTAEGKAVHSTSYFAGRVDRTGVEVLLYGRGVLT